MPTPKQPTIIAYETHLYWFQVAILNVKKRKLEEEEEKRK